MLAIPALLLGACNDDILQGDPSMSVQGDFQKAYFGDSIHFTVKASDPEVALSTLRAELVFGEEVVSEKVIRTKQSGVDYSDKLFVPVLANIPEGTATIRLTLQNINFTKKIDEYPIKIERPDYPSLTLLTEDGTEYTMTKREPNVYGVTERFPQEVKGKIILPKYGENGNELTLGYENSEITVGAEGQIPFSNAAAGKYTISLNTESLQGSPFTILTLNDQRFEQIDDTHLKLDLNLSKGDMLTPSGFPNYNDWWIDPDYLVKNEDGTLTFNAYSGNYRIIADLGLQYFRIYKLNGDQPATLNTDGTGAVWVIGNNIGYPSVSSNQVGWTTENALCMAPTSDKTYQITFIGGKTIDTNAIDFKFFHQMGWGGEFGASSLVSQSDLIGIGTGTDGHDDGNLYLKDGKTLEANGVYVFTINLQGGAGDGILTVEYQGQQQFQEKPVWVNGVKMLTADNIEYSAQLSLKQNDMVSFKELADVDLLYADPDYFTFDEDENAFKFNPVAGDYKIKLNTGNKTLSAIRVNADGSDMTLSNGNGPIWMMGWGVGTPNLDSQIGWDPGKAYCMAEVAPKVYQFTGLAGPEKGSSTGDRFRFDYLSFKFFFQNGWGGEFSGDNKLTLTGDASKFIKDAGNFELASGVKLEEGATYRITIDLNAGVAKGTINFQKL